MADLIGQRLGQYEITALLGEGGMATVYRARQLNIKRDVAVKVIESKLARNPEFVKRFEREAQTIATLNHPHILKLFDFGQQSDLLYLVMELQPGGSLADLIRKSPLPLEQVSQLLDQIASALDYAHEQGIIHRDLKPQNVLLDTKGNAILTDFGIAKVLSETTALTASGMSMGTPAYMSPEQWQGRVLDARSDIYALGVMLFEMLSGRLPFSGDTPASIMYMHLQEPPPPITTLRRDLPLSVEKVINKALAKSPMQRFPSAGHLAAAFRLALTGQTTPGVEVQPPGKESVGVTAPRPTPLTTETTVPPVRSSRRTGLLVLAMIILVTVIGVLAIVLSSGGQTATPTAATGPATTLAVVAASTPTAAQTEAATLTYTSPPPIRLPTLTETRTAPVSTATHTPMPTTTSTTTPNLETLVAATFTQEYTLTLIAIASYTWTPTLIPSATPNLQQTLQAAVAASRTANAIISLSKTPPPTATLTNTPQPRLTAQRVCTEDGVATFTVTNSGGTMSADEGYVVNDANGNTVKSGTIKLDSGASTTMQVTGVYGKLTLSIPSRNATVNTTCIEPSKTPINTSTYTNTPQPNLTARAVCTENGVATITVTNSGSPMSAETAYVVVDSQNQAVANGMIKLESGQSTTVEVKGVSGNLTLQIPQYQVSAVTTCATPATPYPVLTAAGVCSPDRVATFTITNDGGAMSAEIAYVVVNSQNQAVANDMIKLESGQSSTVEVKGISGSLTLKIKLQELSPALPNVSAVTTCATPATPYPALTAAGVCSPDRAVTFTITNDGGAMSAEITYVVVNSQNQAVANGMIKLESGQSTTVEVKGVSGSLTLQIPLSDLSSALPNVSAVTTCATPATPYPALTAAGVCSPDGVATFTVTNSGGAMSADEGYIVKDANGNTVKSGTIKLGSGASTTIQVTSVYGKLRLSIPSPNVTVDTTCIEPTTPQPQLTAQAVCTENGVATFTVTNSGGVMSADEGYLVKDANSNTVKSGTIKLGSGASTTIQATGVYGTLTLSIPSRNVTVDTTCIEPSKTPTNTPTYTNTPEPRLTAQAFCAVDGVVAFAVTNTGGTMLAEESYSIKDAAGNTDTSGTIKLDSGAFTTIEGYVSYGTVTFSIPSHYINITANAFCAGTPVVQLPTPTPTAPKCGYTTLGPDGFPVMDETACAPDQPLPRPAWTPISIGAGICTVWSVYHTNHTGTWEIFRLGNPPDDPTAPANLSQGNKKGVYSIKPSLSPDREWFAFSTNRDGNWEIYIGASNGRSKPVRVTYRQYATSTDPVWSPNGQYIMYESNRDGNWELYMFDVTNGQEIRLTENRATDTNAFWSPDSTKVVFQSLRDKIWQIYELDVKTLDVKRLSDGKGSDRNPEYSYDGKLIVFSTTREGSNGVIALMNADGTGFKAISDAKGDANNTAWSPDDKLIAYQSFIAGTQRNIGVFVYELATGKTRLVTQTTNYASFSPSWYCGTADLLFASDATGNNEIFTVSAVPISAPPVNVLKDATQLTNNPGFSNQYPENSPAEEDASNRWVNLPTG